MQLCCDERNGIRQHKKKSTKRAEKKRTKGMEKINDKEVGNKSIQQNRVALHTILICDEM